VRIGLAMSDPDLILAWPSDTIQRAGRGIGAVAEEIHRLAEESGASRVVIGLALNMNGTEGPNAAEARRLADALEALGSKTLLQDERRSSVQAEAQLRQAGRSARRQRAVVDQAAAVVILQAALDAARDGFSATG
jgi:putative Holliday junction resolvase